MKKLASGPGGIPNPFASVPGMSTVHNLFGNVFGRSRSGVQPVAPRPAAPQPIPAQAPQPAPRITPSHGPVGPAIPQPVNNQSVTQSYERTAREYLPYTQPVPYQQTALGPSMSSNPTGLIMRPPAQHNARRAFFGEIDPSYEGGGPPVALGRDAGQFRSWAASLNRAIDRGYSPNQHLQMLYGNAPPARNLPSYVTGSQGQNAVSNIITRPGVSGGPSGPARQANNSLQRDLFRHMTPPEPWLMSPSGSTPAVASAQFMPGVRAGSIRFSPTNAQAMRGTRDNLQSAAAMPSTLVHETTHLLGSMMAGSGPRGPTVARAATEMPAALADSLYQQEAARRAAETVLNYRLPVQSVGAALGGGHMAPLSALAANRGSSEHVMPSLSGWAGYMPQYRGADPLQLGLRAAWQSAQNNNFFQPRDARSTLNIYPHLEAAMRYMAPRR